MGTSLGSLAAGGAPGTVPLLGAVTSANDRSDMRSTVANSHFIMPSFGLRVQVVAEHVMESERIEQTRPSSGHMSDAQLNAIDAAVGGPVRLRRVLHGLLQENVAEVMGLPFRQFSLLPAYSLGTTV